MVTVNMHEAKTRLSALVDDVESGRQSEIVIARNGRPAVRLVPIMDGQRARRGGLAKGKYVIPDTIDRDEDEIARLFDGEEA